MPPTSPARPGSTRSTITRTIDGIAVPMPSPSAAITGPSRPQGGSVPAGKTMTSAAVPTRPVAERAKPSEGVLLPSHRPIAGLKVEPTRKPVENGRIDRPDRKSVV